MALSIGYPVTIADTEAEATGQDEGTTYYAKDTNALLCETSGGVKNVLENALIDAATAGAGGVALRAAGTIIGIAGAPVAGRQLTVHTQAGQFWLRTNSSVALIELATDAGAVHGRFYRSGTVMVLEATDAEALAFSTNNVERMRIAALDAEVGIGLPPVDAIALALQVGAGADPAHVGGVLAINTTEVGTDADTNEKDLATYSIPANTVETNGAAIRIRAWGVCAANTNGKRMRLYFGGQAIADTTAGNYNGSAWALDALVVRTGAATQDARGSATAMLSTIATVRETHSEPAETLSGAVVAKITGLNATAAANDTVVHGFTVEYLPFGN